MLKQSAAICLALTLGACATAQPKPSGWLSSYQGLSEQSGNLRVAVRERANQNALARVRSVSIDRTVYTPGVDTSWMSPKQRVALLREVDAQLCFELSKYYDIAPRGRANARVRAGVTGVDKTGETASVVSAAAGMAIPGPFGIRPGSTGGLSAEVEMLRGRAQIAALTFSRDANTIGMDKGSLSPIGDALQFASALGNVAGKEFRPPDAKAREFGEGVVDPCKGYGPRFRPEGWAAKMVTGLYVPEASGAKKAKPEPPPVRRQPPPKK